MQRAEQGYDQRWFKTFEQYYDRPEWELFDLNIDPQELTNLAEESAYQVSFLEAWTRISFS